MKKSNSQMSPQVIRITTPLEMGEGPHWDCDAKALYFVDMHYSEIHKYIPESNLYTHAVVGEFVSLKVPVNRKIEILLLSRFKVTSNMRRSVIKLRKTIKFTVYHEN